MECPNSLMKRSDHIQRRPPDRTTLRTRERLPNVRLEQQDHAVFDRVVSREFDRLKRHGLLDRFILRHEIDGRGEHISLVPRRIAYVGGGQFFQSSNGLRVTDVNADYFHCHLSAPRRFAASMKDRIRRAEEFPSTQIRSRSSRARRSRYLYPPISNTTRLSPDEAGAGIVLPDVVGRPPLKAPACESGFQRALGIPSEAPKTLVSDASISPASP